MPKALFFNYKQQVHLNSNAASGFQRIQFFKTILLIGLAH